MTATVPAATLQVIRDRDMVLEPYMPALRAVVPGPRHGDQAQDGVEGLVPVAGEAGLVAVPARDARAAVAPVGGQQLL